MIHLGSGGDSRDVIFAAADGPFLRGPDPADIFLPPTQPVDISSYLRAADPDGSD